MKIELIYFESCPNHQKAFDLLKSILAEHGFGQGIECTEIKSDDDALRHKFVGSPTIRINGIDVDPVDPSRRYARTCRVYLVEGKFNGLPSRSMIEGLLKAS